MLFTTELYFDGDARLTPADEVTAVKVRQGGQDVIDEGKKK